MPTQLGEKMTGSPTNLALPQRICTITALKKAHQHNPQQLTFRHPPKCCIGPARPGIKTVRPRYPVGAPT
jgi:hypothetical protein